LTSKPPLTIVGGGLLTLKEDQQEDIQKEALFV
jgi:hypothetical protein